MPTMMVKLRFPRSPFRGTSHNEDGEEGSSSSSLSHNNHNEGNGDQSSASASIPPPPATPDLGEHNHEGDGDDEIQEAEGGRERRSNTSSSSSRTRKAVTLVASSLFDSPRRALLSRKRRSGGGSISSSSRHQDRPTTLRSSNVAHHPHGGTSGTTTSSNNRQVSPNVVVRPNTKVDQNVKDVTMFSALPEGARERGGAGQGGSHPLPMEVDEEQTLRVNAPNRHHHNVLSWLQDDAPGDILPRVLSFAGSRRLAMLSLVNKSWNRTVRDEAVWRTCCEDTRKWAAGDPVPRSWLQHYRDNPCVPIDYDTIESAFHGACTGPGDNSTVFEDPNSAHRYRELRKSVRILLHPGKYVLRESLVMHGIGSAELSIETVQGPQGHFAMPCHYEQPSEAAPSSAGRPSRSLRDILTCRSSAALEEDDDMSDDASDVLGVSSMPTIPTCNEDVGGSAVHCRGGVAPRTQLAVIILKSRKPNEPIVRVRQGRLRLRRLGLVHNCIGTDIWNGNAAVQVQPPFDDDDRPMRVAAPNLPPMAYISQCDISSISGRGVVVIDGGRSLVKSCYIHNCAATGIYVGGTGSASRIERTDVLENGNGNERNRRGIARGHSGIYLEQGLAAIRDCNISNNSLTGISAISTDNATLQVEESDLVANGSIQLEMPPSTSLSGRRSMTRNNNLSQHGKGRLRSGLVPEEDANPLARIRRLLREQPQSPSSDGSPAFDRLPPAPAVAN